MDSQGSGKTTWMVIAGICAIAAIGLGIWAFSLKSDVDDKEDQLEKSHGATATATAVAATEKQRYERVRRRLARARAQDQDLSSEIKKQSSELKQARQEVSEADSADEKTEAQLKQAQATASLAATCAHNALLAMGDLVNAASTQQGADEALSKLEKSQTDCEDALNP